MSLWDGGDYHFSRREQNTSTYQNNAHYQISVFLIGHAYLDSLPSSTFLKTSIASSIVVKASFRLLSLRSKSATILK